MPVTFKLNFLFIYVMIIIFCFRLGYITMHLSTNDQHIFYKRIGYTESTPVDAVRKCTAILKHSHDDDDTDNHVSCFAS